MNGAGNQFLSGSRFSKNHHRRIRASYGLHLLKYVLQRGAFPYDFFKIVFGSDLIFQVELLLRQLVLQFSDFLKRQGVIDRDRNLVGHFAEQIQIALSERGLLEAADTQGSEKAFPASKRQPASGLNSGVEKQLRCFGREILDAESIDQQRVVCR